MVDLAKFVPQPILPYLTSGEQDYLNEVFTRFNGYPKLQQIWQLMDEQWIALACDPEQIDERVTLFYRHPVWMLNGIFIEQDSQSIENRLAFTGWVKLQQPNRVADFGGGFGGLARLVGQALPGTQIEVVEPHPHPAAIALAESMPNVRFVPELTGNYDLLIATDVFEHVPDPIGLAADTAQHLRVGGKYLIANCFQPVVLCHLPQLFYFNLGWDTSMRAMGLASGNRVKYAREYQRAGDLDVNAAREVGERVRKLYPWFRWLPWRVGEVFIRIYLRNTQK